MRVNKERRLAEAMQTVLLKRAQLLGDDAKLAAIHVFKYLDTDI